MVEVDRRREHVEHLSGGVAATARREFSSRQMTSKSSALNVVEGMDARTERIQQSAVMGREDDGVVEARRDGAEGETRMCAGLTCSRKPSRPVDATNVGGEGDEPDASMFNCNICMEMANYAVVTMCGHLYCWPCLYRWLHMQKNARTCPVCKAGVDRDKVIPVYGRGGNGDPRKMDGGLEEVPPRPVGQRPLPVMLGRPGLPGGMSRSQVGYMPNISVFGSGYGEGMTPEQQHQAFLSRLLLMLGSVVIVCLLFM
jgi:E3 ubiquitin-protein ligase RNF5